jgi:aspartyl-tRNA(Asn)/glutamyl-tRNA(Gln) amidotransferase subunit B
MDKINQVFFLLIARDRIATPDGLYIELNKLITNDLFSLMGEDWDIAKVDSEKPHIKEALNDIAYLLAAKAIEHRHAKIILSKAWNTVWYDWELYWYLKDSGILDEKDGNELDDILSKVFAKNEKAVNDIKGGKDKAVGSLIGQVMRLSEGKADPKTISKRILELLK